MSAGDFTPLRRSAINPATTPPRTPAQLAAVAAKTVALRDFLQAADAEFGSTGEPRPLAFANSLGAEDMVLGHLILGERLPIDVFVLDTGRLPAETYQLLGTVEQRYGVRPQVFFPAAEAVETLVATQGINGFYAGIEQRKACCRVRKLDPLARALAGRSAWITGLRAAQSVTRNDLATREDDAAHGLIKLNPLAAWSESEIWLFLREHDVPFNALHEAFYPSIGCAPCTRAVAVGEDIRAGRWWWENPETKECGLHAKH